MLWLYRRRLYCHAHAAPCTQSVRVADSCHALSMAALASTISPQQGAHELDAVQFCKSFAASSQKMHCLSPRCH